MKKVLALVMAVMMLATVAMAAATAEDDIKYHPSVAPSTDITVSQKEGIGDNNNLAGLTHYTATSTASVTTTEGGKDVARNAITITGSKELNSDGEWEIKDTGEVTSPEASSKTTRGKTDHGYITSVQDMLFRSVTNENYSVTGLKVTVGRSLVKGVIISDADEEVQVQFVKDLNNTTAKSFDLSFTLKGKGKMIIADAEEAAKYNEYTGKADLKDNQKKHARDRVTIPSVKFTMSGTVGYGKVEIFLGSDTDEDLEDIDLQQGVDFKKDVVKFSNGNNIGDYSRISKAGAFTADAILTQHYGEALTMEARVYAGDTLYFRCKNDPDRDVVGRLADSDADMDFYLFDSDKNFTTFNSNVKLYFNDAEEDDYVYQIKDDQTLVPAPGEYNEDEGCWIVKTRTLGKYVVSDVELKEFEAAANAADDNPDTGANDVVGIATALAAVALVSAAAISLKK